MKVIFIQTLKNSGKKHDVKDVPDGYAQNFLFPKKVAIQATPKALADLKKELDTIRVGKDVQATLLEKNLEALSGITLELSLPANEEGHLFSGLRAKDIVAELSKRHAAVEEKAILLEKPIKTVGTHEVRVQLGGKTGSFTLVIAAA